MKRNRRSFLKLAGLGAAGSTLLPGCSERNNTGDLRGSAENNWQSNAHWREIKYGAWKGPGVPEGSSKMDGVRLKDYAPTSSLVRKETHIARAKYPVIDVHVHHYPARAKNKKVEDALAEWVQTQSEVGIEKSVVLTGATGEDFDKLAELYLGRHPDHFQLFCGLDTNNLDDADYSARAVSELERCYKVGARGVGEMSDKGFGLTRDKNLPPEKRLHPDDQRLTPFWEKCAALKLPVNIHIADHPSAWQPPDVFQERTPVFQQFNKHDDKGLSHEDLIQRLLRLLKKHPQTTFIACHLANLGHDLERLASVLDKFPNLSLDISARDYEVGRQPRAAARFLTKYYDRVLFGTDMGMEKTMYENWWRLLESSDEYIEGRVWWRYYGLELPDPVLSAVYRDNASRILNFNKV